MTLELRQHCGTSERRQKVIAATTLINGLPLNGIDFVEVLDDDAPSEELRQRIIDVTFLKVAGVAALTASNFVIEGGVRILGIDVETAGAGPDSKTRRLRLSRAGDFALYRLRVLALGSDDPPPNMDPVLSQVEFSFKADCPTDFDCLPPAVAPETPRVGPAIDYLAKDYESFRRLMLDRMAVTMPAWKERSPADLGVTIVEALAYGADMASYYQDAVSTEAYLSRARLRASVRRHTRLLGYGINEGCNSRTFVSLHVDSDVSAIDPPILPKGSMVLTQPPASSGFGTLPPKLPPEPGKIGAIIRSGSTVFETMEPVTVLKVARNEMKFHSWSGTSCCLPKGTTVAYLVGTLADTGLSKGDVLIFEEKIPLGASAADPPDATHRQAVRLSEQPRELKDLVENLSVLEVRWYVADALGFVLNIESYGTEPGAVAHANVVLADHGRTLDYAAANPPGPVDETMLEQIANSLHADLRNQSALKPAESPEQGRYAPSVTVGPITRAVAYDQREARGRPAAEALKQAASEAVPQISLAGGGERWQARADLLSSDPLAPEFVLESKNDGTAQIRFGDGRFGKAFVPDTAYRARLRVGNGPSGRIGATAKAHLVTDASVNISAVKIPLAAVGGDPPESLTAIKLAAPRAFKRQRRAVTAGDYAEFAQMHPEVQRAVAERRWTGSWHTMFVAIDRKAGRDVDADFEREMVAFLEPYRLAGHDVEIEPPAYVPLDIQLIVCVAPGHYGGQVEQALLTHFGAGVRPDGTRGFFHPDYFTFGQSVLLSPIVAAAMTIDGVRWIGMTLDGVPETGRFRRLDDQSVDFAEDGMISLASREVARLDNDPNAPERGRLRFVMEGGR